MATMQELRGRREEGRRRERKRGRGETEEEEKETHSAKQDFQSQPVIRCGISIVHHRTGETEGKED